MYTPTMKCGKKQAHVMQNSMSAQSRSRLMELAYPADHEHLTPTDCQERFITLLRVRDFFASHYAASIKDRPLIITPVLGTYAGAAFWVVAVQGSPPKGTMFVDPNTHSCTFIYAQGKVQRIPAGESVMLFIRFIRLWTESMWLKAEPFKIDIEGKVIDLGHFSGLPGVVANGAAESVLNVMQIAQSKHGDSWLTRPGVEDLLHAREHLEQLLKGDTDESHLEHALTRLALVLTRRRLANGTKGITS